MEKNIAGKKTTSTLLLTLFYFTLSEGGCNLVSGNVYGRVESARAVGECFQKLVSDPD